MAVYKRIQKIDGYTMMSNYHLRDMNLSLKASGLLSLVLSLPADWKYSVSGLTAIVKEGKSAVMSALKELEENGYLKWLPHIADLGCTAIYIDRISSLILWNTFFWSILAN